MGEARAALDVVLKVALGVPWKAESSAVEWWTAAAPAPDPETFGRYCSSIARWRGGAEASQALASFGAALKVASRLSRTADAAASVPAPAVAPASDPET